MADLSLSPRPRLLTPLETATYLGVRRPLIYAAIRRGELPVVRLGGKTLIPRPALKRMLREAGCEVLGQPVACPPERSTESGSDRPARSAGRTRQTSRNGSGGMSRNGRR